MFPFAHWVHNLDPFVIRFHGDFGIRWYGLAYVVGILITLWLFLRWQRQGRVPLTPSEVIDFCMVAALGMLIGGRLGYFVFYQWDTLLHRPWEVFDITSGGMASHGGLLGFAVAIGTYCRVKRRSFLVLVDVLAVTVPIGVFLGRVANFVNGELWGRPTTVPWAVIFPDAPEIGGVMVPRHPSQLYAAVLEGLVVFGVSFWVHQRHRRPGLTLGVAFVVYGIVRFATEFWREPNTGYDLYFGWMTKGQALTIPWVIFAGWLVWNAFRNPPRPEAYLPPTENKTGSPAKGCP